MGIDLVGIGAGPANLSLAALLTTARERETFIPEFNLSRKEFIDIFGTLNRCSREL